MTSRRDHPGKASRHQAADDGLPVYTPTDLTSPSPSHLTSPHRIGWQAPLFLQHQELDDEPLSATLRRLGAKRKTAVLRPTPDEDEWEDVVDNARTSATPPPRSHASYRPSRRRLPRECKPLPAPPLAPTRSHQPPIPDGWGGRLTRPSWFPSHQPGPLLRTPAPIRIRGGGLASLLEPLPGASSGAEEGKKVLKAVRFASWLPTWRPGEQQDASVNETEALPEYEQSRSQDGKHTLGDIERQAGNEKTSEWLSEAALNLRREAGHSAPTSRKTILIRSLLALCLLALLLGLAIGLSAPAHSRAPNPNSSATASRITPGVASTESTPPNPTALPSTASNMGVPPLLQSSPAPASTQVPPAGPTPTGEASPPDVMAGSHHAKLVSQAIEMSH